MGRDWMTGSDSWRVVLDGGIVVGMPQWLSQAGVEDWIAYGGVWVVQPQVIGRQDLRW